MFNSFESKPKNNESVIKQNMISGLDRLEEAAKKGKISQSGVSSMLNLLREDGPLANDPDREKMLERLNLMAPEKIKKIEAHNKEVREKRTKEAENPIKLNIMKGLDGMEETNKEEISKREVRTISNLLREDGPLADDLERESLLERINNIDITEIKEKKD